MAAPPSPPGSSSGGPPPPTSGGPPAPATTPPWPPTPSPPFGELPLAAIDYLTVTAWVASLTANGKAPATVVKAYQVVNKAMRAAVSAKMLPANPCHGVPLPRIETEEMRFLTPTELARLAECIDPRFRALVLVAAAAGLRLGELTGLRRHRVSLSPQRSSLTVATIITEVDGTLIEGPPKTRASRRTVSLPNGVAAELAHHLKVYAEPAPKGLVFPAASGGPLRASNFRHRIWRPAVTAAQLPEPHPTPHDLRHTAVALWIEAGASPKAIASRAGHTSVKTVLDTYGHLLPEADERLRDRLDTLFATSTEPAVPAAAALAGQPGGPTEDPPGSRPQRLRVLDGGQPLASRDELAPRAGQMRAKRPRQGSGQRSGRGENPGLTSENGEWACQDLNLGPHPYQGCALTA
jgi:integrase